MSAFDYDNLDDLTQWCKDMSAHCAGDAERQRFQNQVLYAALAYQLDILKRLQAEPREPKACTVGGVESTYPAWAPAPAA